MYTGSACLDDASEARILLGRMEEGYTDRERARVTIRGSSRRVVFLVGSLWEAARFFLVLLVVGLLIETASGTGPWLYPWLLFAASGSLLIAAGGFLIAAVPARIGGLIGILRLGKGLALFTFVLLVASGSLGAVAGREVVAAGPYVLTAGPIAFAVFALDLLHFAFLLWVPARPGRTGPPGEDAQPPLAGPPLR